MEGLEGEGNLILQLDVGRKSFLPIFGASVIFAKLNEGSGVVFAEVPVISVCQNPTGHFSPKKSVFEFVHEHSEKSLCESDFVMCSKTDKILQITLMGSCHFHGE